MVLALIGSLMWPPLEASAAVPVDPEHQLLLVRWVEGVDPATREDVIARAVSDLVADPQPVTPRVDALAIDGASRVALERLERDPRVQVAELDHPITAPAADTVVEPLEPPVDDPLFPLQWGLRNIGQPVGPDNEMIVGLAGVDSRASSAWPTTRGNDDVVVAVIDTAVDASHPDLLGAVVKELSTFDETPNGGDGHGTAVASVIAARSSDGFGMAGVAPGISLLSLAAFATPTNGGAGESSLASVVTAFELAVEAGADIINASWVTSQDSPLLRAVVADAGVPVVAASGNDGRELTATSTTYPAGYDLPNVVSVTAVAPSGEVPPFANVGKEIVDVAAPGSALVIALPGEVHGWGNGTSFAAPHVSGALALARSVAPYATTAELVDAVSWTSRATSQLEDVTITGGMLDVAALVRGVQRPVCRSDRNPLATFPDVADSNVHAVGINCIVASGVSSGRADGTYGPNAMVTRAQVASFLYRILQTAADQPPAANEPGETHTKGAPEGGGTEPTPTEPDGMSPPEFSDVDPDGAHAEAIHRLAELGIVKGGPDGLFRPSEAVTRGQLASFLVRTYEHLSGISSAPSRRWFEDTADSSHRDAIGRARDLGLVRGVASVRFEPSAVTRRDQMASLLAQLIDALAREGVIRP